MLYNYNDIEIDFCMGFCMNNVFEIDICVMMLLYK